MLCLGDGGGGSRGVDHGVVGGNMGNGMNGHRKKKGWAPRWADQQDGVQRKKKERNENRGERRLALSLSRIAHFVARQNETTKLTRKAGRACLCMVEMEGMISIPGHES